jgi:hypothetical protein
MALGTGAKFGLTFLAGSVFGAAGLQSCGGGGEKAPFRSTIETRLSAAASGGKLSLKDVRTEALHAPSGDALKAAEYNMAENMGAKDPSQPDKRTAADVLCAIGAASFTRDDVHDALAKWQAGHEANQAGDDALADNRFNAAANACGGLLLRGVAEGTRTFPIPVAAS